MKYSNPYKLLLVGSLFIILGYGIVFLAISFFYYHQINWFFLGISSVLIFGLSYYVFSYILEKFIYEKIKLIYKTIHTLKLSKEQKGKSFDIQKDILQKVNEDVAHWAEQRSTEIEELKKLETYRREFLGNVSHELKTPIFNIQGYILTLLDGALDDVEVNRNYLEKTEKNIERMINIVQDLEIITQLESGEIKLEFKRFDLVAMTREIFEMLEIKANNKGINLCFHSKITEDSHVYVKADKEKIRQVLINLIENSIKYGKDNGRTKVSFYDMDENALIEVSDDGIGIAEKDIPRLFERFYRVDKSRSRNIGGSGLGLAIVKHIIESHEQTINVRSAPGVGSTFSFTLQKG